MDKWDINCVECGKFILTEQRWAQNGWVKCVSGSYENGYYNEDKDVFYCK